LKAGDRSRHVDTVSDCKPAFPGELQKEVPEMTKTYRAKLRTKEAAEYCGSSESKFEKLRVYGGGAPYITIGRTVVYDPDDLDTWMDAHRRRNTSSQLAA